jgi:hypothetical protein
MIQTQRALRVLPFLARSRGDEKHRRKRDSIGEPGRVLFERAPAIINLPGELFRAIDVESADQRRSPLARRGSPAALTPVENGRMSAEKWRGRDRGGGKGGSLRDDCHRARRAGVFIPVCRQTARV